MATRYDVVISEPSNPWVNGVSGLFTTEFYRETKRYLAPGGLLLQWLHLYEFNDQLLASILSALGENFSDYEVYSTNTADIVVIAVATGRVPRPVMLPQQEPAFLAQLKRVGILRLEEVTARSLGTKRQLAPLFAAANAPVNSDFFPFVQLQSPLARFAHTSANAILDLSLTALPVIEMVGGASTVFLREPVAAHVSATRLRLQSSALNLARGLIDLRANPLASNTPSVRAILLALKRPGALCDTQPTREAIDQLHNVAMLTLSHLGPDLRHALWIERPWLDCTPESLSLEVRQRIELYAAVATRDARTMLARARAQLEASGESEPQWQQFALLTAMIGAQAAGDPAAAQQLWRTYGSTLYSNGTVPAYVLYAATRSIRTH